MPKSFFRRGVVVICILLAALVLVRPQAERLRWRVSQSISLALGKRVQVGSLHLRFLPRPGFELTEFVVYDDPGFGSEPLLRAEDVTASVRLTSLFRGRFEVSRLSLDGASLNLNRDSEGRWDLQDLLQRTTQMPTAPTASGYRESRPEFPYVEASRARINFKIGTEKTHFALTDAEFAFWQESENVWGMRLKARPIRTDASLTDTGVVNLNGSWQRAGDTNGTPIDISFQWKQAQAGQISKLVSGTDKGWRGSVLVSGRMSGTAEQLRIVADTSIDDFGRYDVLNGDALLLAARCVANYQLTGNSLSDVDCAAPAGSGYVELKGNATGLPFTSCSFILTGNRVPASYVLALLRHTAGGVPHNSKVEGFLSSEIELARARADDPLRWKGDGEVVDFALTSGSSSAPLRLERIPFTLVSTGVQTNNGSANGAVRFDVGPINIALGRPSPLQARASFSLAEYNLAVRGDAGVKRLLQAASMLGIPAPAVSADGSANVDLQISGTWAAAAPTVTGSAQLRNVHAQVRGLNAPLDVRNANLLLANDAVRVQNLNTAAGDTQWRGSMVVPRPCSNPRDCTLQFNLHAGEVNAASLNRLLNPSARKQSWYKFLSFGDKQLSYLLQARATGKLSIEKVTFGHSTSSQFSADVIVDQGKLTVANMRSTILGGKIAGEWKADFTARPPTYKGSGGIEDASLDQISGLMHDAWVEGAGSAHYEFRTEGWNLQDLVGNADLTANFDLQNARFPHVVLTTKGGPLRVKAFSGNLMLKDGEFSFQDAKLNSADVIYRVSGTASLTGALKLKMASEGTAGYDLSGTLTRTRVSQLAATSARASLKP